MTTRSPSALGNQSFTINGSTLSWSPHQLPFTVKSFPRPYTVDEVQTLAAYHAIVAEADFIIADKNIANLYTISKKELAHVFIVDPTEENKSLETVSSIIDRMIDFGVSKGSSVVAIGGGVIQDLSACACALFRRGQPFTYLPTTTLGQLDSCVGAKCAVNTHKAKNILGLFSAPNRVQIPIFMIQTMPLAEHRAGLAEMLRLCLTASSGAVEAYRNFLPDIADPASINLSAYSEAVSLSLSIKKAVVEFDEYERDARRSMNYGHTFGHAIEKLSGFQIPHGLGVLLGMHIANLYATSIGIMKPSCLQSLLPIFRHSIAGVSLPFSPNATINPEEVISQFRYDKKGDGTSVPLILIETPGSMVFHQYIFSQTHDVLAESIRAGLDEFSSWIKQG